MDLEDTYSPLLVHSVNEYMYTSFLLCYIVKEIRALESIKETELEPTNVLGLIYWSSSSFVWK